MQERVYLFPGEAKATLPEVGGKGLSLMESAHAGLPVPGGFILTVHFFDEWISALKYTAAWKHFLQAPDDKLQHACDELKTAASAFHFTVEQEKALAEALSKFPHEALFAARSSSPNEDLEGASFAGGYETVLGVNADTLHGAIKKCFQSALDYRVVVYLRANSFVANDPKIAVVVQEQIASEISGVGFSLNPVTNNYDDAVFNANWGLGETVVAGLVTPDTFIVDKVHEEVKDVNIGSKATSLWLVGNGGTEEKQKHRSEERTLWDKQLVDLTRLIKQVEQKYKMPMDIEWAFAGDKLFLLQARPITTYVPLSPELMTVPGARKRLYFDVTATAQAMAEPMSKMGSSLFRHLLKVGGGLIFLRDISKSVETTIPWISDGKFFFNVSNGLKLAGKRKVMELMPIVDELGAKALGTLDERVYVSPTWKLRLLPYGLMWRLPKVLLMIRRAKRDPEAMHAFVQQRLRDFDAEVVRIAEQNASVSAIWGELLRQMFLKVIIYTIPLTIASRYAAGRMKAAVGRDPDAGKLLMALPHNVTIEMGLMLADVAKLLPEELDADELETKLKSGELPEAFLRAWTAFLDAYGFRGAAEIDVAAVRYYDDPKLLIDLLLSTKNAGGETPTQAFERKAREREAAYGAMHTQMQANDSRKASLFESDYRFFSIFGGYRETHKKYLVMGVAIIRRIMLATAQTWVADGRLDRVDQVFDLTMEQYEAALGDRSLDLRKLGRDNTAYLRKLARVKRPPALIDSRGFIPQPPRPPMKPGEHAGAGVSVGMVRGHVKVLHSPNEKPLLKGEILVARATDPGWTPLFVNAGGIILEIGGSLQHGALVAREYGIPCVAGVENATTIWKDGALVEVDGTSGIVRTISRPPKKSC